MINSQVRRSGRAFNEQRGHIAPQGTVVIQTRTDVNEILNRGRQASASQIGGANDGVVRYPITGAGSDSIYRIDIFDLVYSIDAHRKPSTTYGGFYASSVPIMSALNGIYKVSNESKEFVEAAQVGTVDRENRRSLVLSERIRFVGVAMTEANSNNVVSPHMSQEQVTVMVRGTVTVMNTGSSHIRIGETVMWKVPTESEFKEMSKQMRRAGRAPDKVPLMLVPRRAAMEDVPKVMMDFLDPNQGVGMAEMIQPSVVRFAIKMRAFMIKVALAGQIGDRANFDGKAYMKDNYIERTLKLPAGSDIATAEKNLHDVFGYYDDNDMLKYLVGAFLELDADMQRRTVGTAMSFAEPYDALDLYVKGG